MVVALNEALSDIDAWLLRFASLEKCAGLLGLQRSIEKKYTQCVFFLQALRVSAQLLNLTCQFNRLIPIEVRICLVVSDDPGALAPLTGFASLFKKTA